MPVKDLKETLKHMATCLPAGVTYEETKYGATFRKGKRSFTCNVDLKKKKSYQESMKINKYPFGYGIIIDKSLVKSYTSIKEVVKKGLAIE